MKKVYTKPVIVIEDFSLSTNIAGNCDVIIDTQSSGMCGLDFGGTMIFITDYAGCQDFEVSPDDGQYNGICYHVPTSNNDMFNS